MIVGLDLSLSGLGMVACPPSWDLDWRHVRFESLASKLRQGATRREELERLRALAEDVCSWCERRGAAEVWAEDLPAYVPPKAVHAIKKLAELRGVVRYLIAERLGLTLEFVDEVTARKVLLGWVPPKDRKQHVSDALKRAGDPFRYDDERDAFTVVNWRLHELGAPCLTGLLGEKPAKPKKSRKQKGVANGQAVLGMVNP